MEITKEKKEYYKGLIEALVFLSGEPLKLSTLANSIGMEKSVARDFLDEIILDYQEKNGGFILKEIAGGYIFQTNEAYHEILGSIFKEKRRETLSRSTLDTLAIIAYKQPITLPEIDEIRGVSSRAMVTTLISKKLVKAIGQKEVPGRPTLYGTSQDFLLHFGLNKLSDLPTPVEVKELNFENLDDLNEEEKPTSVEKEVPETISPTNDSEVPSTSENLATEDTESSRDEIIETNPLESPHNGTEETKDEDQTHFLDSNEVTPQNSEVHAEEVGELNPLEAKSIEVNSSEETLNENSSGSEEGEIQPVETSESSETINEEIIILTYSQESENNSSENNLPQNETSENKLDSGEDQNPEN